MVAHVIAFKHSALQREFLRTLISLIKSVLHNDLPLSMGPCLALCCAILGATQHTAYNKNRPILKTSHIMNVYGTMCIYVHNRGFMDELAYT